MEGLDFAAGLEIATCRDDAMRLDIAAGLDVAVCLNLSVTGLGISSGVGIRS